ncbi:MAG: DegV family protein [Lachnospiraceae bacterium]
MSKYIITTDSASDLPKDYVKKENLYVQPLFYNFDDQVYGGKNNLDYKDFYNRMRQGEMPVTNAIIPEEMTNGLRPFLEEGYDILHLAFSSGLSSSCQNAFLAAKELEEEFPDRRITVVDTYAASLGEGLLVHKALQLKKQGKSMEEVAKWVEDNRDHLCHLFTVDDLFHLHRGGRVSKTVAVIGTMINIKPVLHVDNAGELKMLKTVRGRKKSLINLVDRMEDLCKGYEEQNDIVKIS